MFKKIFLSFVFCLLLNQAMPAQDWPASEEADYHSSIVKISGDGMSGSGTVIKRVKDSNREGYYVGWIITAAHCINDMNTEFTVIFNGGNSVNKGRAILRSGSSDAFEDYGIIRALIPDNVKPMQISIDEVPVGAEVEMCGYGAGDFRHWVARYGGKNMNSGGHIVFSWAIQGDSGGPIIYKGKVIGVICFGSGIKKFKNTNRVIVGPIYGTNIDRVDEKIEEIPSLVS